MHESTQDLQVIILAAGQGTRMKSALPKVLHTVGSKPMLAHVIDAAHGLNAKAIHVVYGHGGKAVMQRLNHQAVNWVLQEAQLGTGHAVAQAMPSLADEQIALVLYGDVPLIRRETLEKLVNIAGTRGLGLLTANLANPGGYGRIVRDEGGTVIRIVEEKDATEAQRDIKEINTGMLAVNSSLLRHWLSRLDDNNAQGEYYLTDIIGMAAEDGVTIETCHPASLHEIEGVNNKVQLAEIERVYQREQAGQLMLQGVTFMDPNRFDLRGELIVGQDVVIDVNVIIEGRVELGDNVHIGANSVLIDAIIGDDVSIKPNCIVESSTVARGAEIGPFARVRPETLLGENVKVGNFVEIKKSTVAKGSKINHLSYIGDTVMGENVNIGAGTITCNYDGANKHNTVIGDNAFIGSDTQLVAPVEIGAGATIGAGSTITHDASPGKLTLSRSTQKTRDGWKRPVKNLVGKES